MKKGCLLSHHWAAIIITIVMFGSVVAVVTMYNRAMERKERAGLQ
jgi:hypothetical protein